MRPRRRIILIDSNAERRGWTRFVLDNKGYFVICAASCTEAAELGSEEACAGHTDTLLVGYFPVSLDFLQDVAGTLGFPCLLIAPSLPQGIASRIWPSMADVLERVKIAAARKKGPKPLAGIALFLKASSIPKEKANETYSYALGADVIVCAHR